MYKDSVMDYVHCYFPVVLKVIILLAFAIPSILWISSFLERRLRKNIDPFIANLASRLFFYISFISLGIYTLSLFGFHITGILGAAGIIGIAVGFAAQASLSNVISGIFLILEDEFEIGDTLMFGDKMGIVDSINLFSVSLHTEDNRLLRIPNESLLKNPFINLSYYPKRKLVAQIILPRTVNPQRAREIIEDVIYDDDHFLIRPIPIITLMQSEPNLIFEVQVWVKKAKLNHYYEIFAAEIQILFENENIKAEVTHIT